MGRICHRTDTERAVNREAWLSHLYVVHPGTERYDLAARVEAIGLVELLAEMQPASTVRHEGRAKPRRG